MSYNHEPMYDKSCTSDPSPLSLDEIKAMQNALAREWEINDAGTTLSCRFNFKDFYQVMAFVNALAWIVHEEDHHPDLHLSYAYCQVSFTTHAVNGLSENDFICAAKINQLLK